MNLRFSYPVKSIDPGAYGTIANVITEFINYTSGVKTIEISDKQISFIKGLFSKSNVLLSSNNLYYKDGTIYRVSEEAPHAIDPQKASYIMSALRSLKPGYIAKLPF